MKTEEERRIRSGTGDQPEGQVSGRRDVAVLIILVEFVALLIGLAMPITPSKTGGDFSFADLFFEDPSYLQEVFVYFLTTNLLIGILGLVAFVIIKVQSWRRGARAGR